MPHEFIMNGYYIFSKAVSVSTEMIMKVCVWHLPYLMVYELVSVV